MAADKPYFNEVAVIACRWQMNYVRRIRSAAFVDRKGGAMFSTPMRTNVSDLP
jgi:hypothetical protein